MRRVGVVGVGTMGSYHASRWKQLPVELVGYYDRDMARAEALAGELGGKTFGSLDELLAEVDIVDVCTPTYEHAPPVVAAEAQWVSWGSSIALGQIRDFTEMIVTGREPSSTG